MLGHDDTNLELMAAVIMSGFFGNGVSCKPTVAVELALEIREAVKGRRTELNAKAQLSIGCYDEVDAKNLDEVDAENLDEVDAEKSDR